LEGAMTGEEVWDPLEKKFLEKDQNPLTNLKKYVIIKSQRKEREKSK